MEHEENIEEYISLKEAAEVSGYTPDYLGFLIRKGKIVGRKIYSGETWVLSRLAILNYIGKKNLSSEIKKEFVSSGPEYISLKEAANISGYASGYIGWLIRKGKIPGKKIYNSPSWQVDQNSLKRYLALRKEEQTSFEKKETVLKLVKRVKTDAKYFSDKIKNNKPLILFWRFGLATLVIFFLIFGFVPIKTLQSSLIRALTGEQITTLYFYSASSTGEWQNLENVLGSPDVLPNSGIDSFSEKNSAIYTTGPLSIICQNFQQVTEESPEPEIITGTSSSTGEPLPAASTTTSSNSSSTGSLPVQTTTDSTSSFSFLEKARSLLVSKVFAQENNFSAKIKFSFAIGEKKPAIIEQPVTSTVMYQSSSTVITPSDSSTTDRNASFGESLGIINNLKRIFRNLVSNIVQIAKAEDDSGTTSNGTTVGNETATPANVVSENNTSSSFIGETTTTEINNNQSVGVAEETTTETAETSTTITNNIATTTIGETNGSAATETTIKEILPEMDAKIRILWSLDGKAWKLLDTISKSNLSNSLNGGYFEYDAPFLQNFDDIKNLRIQFEGMIGGESSFTAYLDSVWVEVSYRETAKPEQQSTSTAQESTSTLPISGDIQSTSTGQQGQLQVGQIGQWLTSTNSISTSTLLTLGNIQPTSTEQESGITPGSPKTDKDSYSLSDNIKISGAPLGSAVEIYYLDDPDTAPEPSNVFAALIGDDGTVIIEAATLFPGRFTLVNTFEGGHCGGFSLSQCSSRSDFIGKKEISIVNEQH